MVLPHRLVVKTNRKKSEWGAPSQLSQWSVPLLISSLRWVESALKTIFVKKKTRNKSVSHRDERWARTFHCLSLREPQLTPGPPGRAGVPHPSPAPGTTPATRGGKARLRPLWEWGQEEDSRLTVWRLQSLQGSCSQRPRAPAPPPQGPVLPGTHQPSEAQGL